MKKFLIERELPGVGKLGSDDLKTISRRSFEVANKMEEPYHWVQTFVTDHKLYCLHIAPDRETVLKHALEVGFPANCIVEVMSIIDPATGAE
jgi:hypothetical protein